MGLGRYLPHKWAVLQNIFLALYRNGATSVRIRSDVYPDWYNPSHDNFGVAFPGLFCAFLLTLRFQYVPTSRLLLQRHRQQLHAATRLFQPYTIGMNLPGKDLCDNTRSE